MSRKLFDSEKDVRKREYRDANRDPLTGSPGAHPVGVGVGAAGGAAAGAAAGTIAGPAGAILGAAVGAVAGAMVGKVAAEAIDPTVDEAYWKEHYATEPSYKFNRSARNYAAALRAGKERRTRHLARRFEDLERDLAMNPNKQRVENGPLWDENRWEETRAQALEAWNRVERIIPSEAGHGHGQS